MSQKTPKVMNESLSTASDETNDLIDPKITSKKYDSKRIQWDCYGTTFVLPDRYTVTELLGSGAYGTVVKATDSKYPDREPVAIKKIDKTFEHKLYAKRTLRELKILRYLTHENIIELKTILKPLKKDAFTDVYGVFELMDIDLESIIKSDQELSLEHVKYFTYQILSGVKFMHGAGILHRDLKPKNLLVNSECELKICDFGLSRFASDKAQQDGSMTDYVCTRWYRAPEALLGYTNYGTEFDVWSIGCILGTLLLRKPIFNGMDTEDQIKQIIKLMGITESTMLDKAKCEDLYSEKDKKL